MLGFHPFMMKGDLHSSVSDSRACALSTVVRLLTGCSHGSFHLSSIQLAEMGKHNLLKDEGGRWKREVWLSLPPNTCHPG